MEFKEIKIQQLADTVKKCEKEFRQFAQLLGKNSNLMVNTQVRHLLYLTDKLLFYGLEYNYPTIVVINARTITNTSFQSHLLHEFGLISGVHCAPYMDLNHYCFLKYNTYSLPIIINMGAWEFHGSLTRVRCAE